MNSMKKNQFVRICKSIAIHYYGTGKADIKCENKSGKVLVKEHLHGGEIMESNLAINDGLLSIPLRGRVNEELIDCLEIVLE